MQAGRVGDDFSADVFRLEVTHLRIWMNGLKLKCLGRIQGHVLTTFFPFSRTFQMMMMMMMMMMMLFKVMVMLK